ncbi:hypothetical protein Clacol_008437 [Clathrus columnatus]|uniref:Mitochondrial import receptor subunit TOM70 n=1 Tax=Clathrus columnatus TaxID=1419009 RepID=A0AAV5AHQ1_9AGAM|nr:hypothetical protein Clacol_008437 [Clathrus columnatus]
MSSSTSEAAEAGSSEFLTRVRSFFSENKKAIILGTAAAVLAIGGAAYYVSTTRPLIEEDSDPEKGEKKSTKKKGKKKRKSVKDKDGPILEERKSKISDSQTSSIATDEPHLSIAEIEALPPEERTKMAATLKSSGNAAYNSKKFTEAIDFYTRAIEISPKPEAVYYSNRAACYINMKPPKYDLVLRDCDEALKLDMNYVKALNRRAAALEGLDRLKEALRDFTAAAILGKFQDDSAAQSVERVLKKISTTEAQDVLKTREPRLPSHTFISSYFAAFRPRPTLQFPESPSGGDNTLQLALGALSAMDYPHAMTLVNEALEQGISWDAGKAEALNLRGTFKFLVGDSTGAQGDLEQSVQVLPSLTQSWVKVASVHMEQGNPAKAFAAFDSAIAHNPKDPDIYYHRGQDQQRYQDAVDKFDRAIELEKAGPQPMNVLPLVNKGLALFQWKQDSAAAEELCREALTIDPECEAAVATLAQLSLQKGNIDAAVELFSRHADIARSEPELINALTYKYASQAQVEFMKNYPSMVNELGQMARSMI